jgi:heme-degrading monooxygenase HmoA
LANRTPFKEGDETMNARVTIVQILPGKMDEAVGIYRDSVVPAAKEQKGCKGLYLLTDRNTGKGISITLWETAADMTVGENSGYYQQQLGKFKDVFGAPPAREAYEVSVQA